MGIFDDFTQRAVVHSASLDWLASPMPGVERKPLDRVGGEVARATSIVRYAKGSKFSPHVHTGGEEFVVLDGVFQDESGDFPVGSYVRNPPQSSHTPRSDNGCIIFVKLWQFQPKDRTHIRLQIKKMSAIPSQTVGVSITPLYKDKYEEVSVYYFEPNTKMSLSVPEGAEVLVLAGELQAQNDLLQKHSWMRLPLGDTLTVAAKSNGAKFWVKIGNLSDVSNQIKRIQAAN
ncbi:cupin domain-containing protein [Colwellia sp. MB02u-6]|uniref:cupin domain-containing protein n=1 Tax=Colwellia sp. MB02u-6 TaxID=2759824 RepID=UPI0015F66667|nr:cupin domain-containing protein [Colwellia sp. MB02u-6]MBA6329489.1 cupin domain-containing protein [Colwellia sp. MB02u-6]